MQGLGDPETLPLGTVVASRYRVERLLGSGGFGAVFAATETQSGQRVALKVLDSRVLDNLGGDQRFMREAELAQRLDHPNVVRVVEAGRAADGTRFIAFELLAGRSLAEELESWGALTPRRAGDITRQVLDALEAAHAVGIVHRDLKPGNIFLIDGSQQVKVLDFGIAKSTNPGTMAGLTQDGMMLGTPMYMAPEQITGAPVTPATDLFALGLVLLEMLLGRHPYVKTISALELVRGRMSGEPVPIPGAVARTPLAAVIGQATRLAVSERFASAADMRRALEVALDDPRLIDAALTTEASVQPTQYGDSFGATAFTPGPSASPEPVAPFPRLPAGPTPHGHAAPHAVPMAPPMSPPMAPMAPYPIYAPPPPAPTHAAPQPSSSNGPLLVLVLLLAGGFLLAGITGVVLFAVMADSSPVETTEVEAPPRDDEPEEEERDEGPEEVVDEPPDEDLNIPPEAQVRIRPCYGLARLNNQVLGRELSALGWRVSGRLTLCLGNMINFRCDSAGGEGITAELGGDGASVAVVRFGSPGEAARYVAEQAGTSGQTTLGGPDGVQVLYADMPAAQADAFFDRVCAASH
ncbi:MAG: serine/threonine-protein kinase [Polyangiaceae bacterium]